MINRFASRGRLVAALGAATLIGLLELSRVSAQSATIDDTAGIKMSFEVASIKPDDTRSGEVRIGGPDMRRFNAFNATTRMLVEYAYGLKHSQLSGGPTWIDSKRYDVQALLSDSEVQSLRGLPPTARRQHIEEMVQSLLADRFKLRISQETKMLPIYALLVAKHGPKVVPLTAPPPLLPVPGNGGTKMMAGGVAMIGHNGEVTLILNGAPMSELVGALWQQLDRPIVNRTGLQAEYRLTLRWTLDPLTSTSPSQSDVGGMSIFTALQEQLGLRLESTKGPVDVYVIEHIEEPTAN